MRASASINRCVVLQGADGVHQTADPRAGARLHGTQLPDETAPVRDRRRIRSLRETGLNPHTDDHMMICKTIRIPHKRGWRRRAGFMSALTDLAKMPNLRLESWYQH